MDSMFVSIAAFLDFLDLKGAVAVALVRVGADVRSVSAVWTDSTTWEENVTTSANVSASVMTQLGEEPRYFASISRHINADCAMPRRSWSGSLSSESSIEELVCAGDRHPLTAPRRWVVRSRNSARYRYHE